MNKNYFPPNRTLISVAFGDMLRFLLYFPLAVFTDNGSLVEYSYKCTEYSLKFHE